MYKYFNNYKQTLNGTNNLQEFLFDNIILEDEKMKRLVDTDNDELNSEKIYININERWWNTENIF